MSSYALIDAADAVLVYASTTGLEAAVRGKPVIIAGDMHYRGRGFTVDLDNPEDLRRVIDEGVAGAGRRAGRARAPLRVRLLLPAHDAAARGARADEPRLRQGRTTTSRSTPGDDPYLDLIVDRILDGEPLSTPRHMVRDVVPFPDIA